MQTRNGFARPLPLAVLVGIAAGALAFLVSAEPAREPKPAPPPAFLGSYGCGCGCASSVAAAPRPTRGISGAAGRLWDLSAIRGHTLRGLALRDAQWGGVDLHGATFVDCDFRRANLQDADLHDVTFRRCHLEGACLGSIRLDPGPGVWFEECYLRGALGPDGSNLGEFRPSRQGRATLGIVRCLACYVKD